MTDLPHPPPFGGRPRWPKPGSARAQRLRTAIRAAPLLARPWLFAGCEIVRFDGLPRRWDLRGGGTVFLRSGTSDIDIFAEIHGRRIYAPPAAVRMSLHRAPVALIADLGANVGLFGEQALREYPGARVISYEPDPWNLRVLRSCQAASVHPARWSVRPAVASVRQGAMRFLAVAGALSREAGTGEPGAIDVPEEDVFAVLERADLAKIDIEGGEWRLLADPRLRTAGPRVVALEYHATGCPAPDAAVEARNALARAGYTVEPLPGSGPECGQLWAWRDGPDPT